MSSKAKKMAMNIVADATAGNKVVVPFKVTFKVDDNEVYTIVYVSGVPENMDPDDPTIKHAAEQQFVNFLNSRIYLEMYEPNQNHRTDYPIFLNMSKALKVKVTNVERIE